MNAMKQPNKNGPKRTVPLSDRPSLLCVMTRGTYFSQLLEVISGISKLVYNKINVFFTQQ